ncbi:MAG: hypothetical protein H7Y31_13840 [Chitinophagaceae bacterium]|nr:hypothetical protein [Chitinophagaceae bacterium]
MKLYNRIKNKLNTLLSKEVTAPTYEFKRQRINDMRTKYGINVLVETGTFLGDTVEHFKNLFTRVFSIELADELAAKAQKRFESDSNVRIIQGDSAEVLKTLVDEINQPTLFWLDGHYSSEFYMGDQYIKTGRGKKDTPVEEELKLIFKNPLNHIILIDDARLFLGIDDYPSIAEIKSLVRKHKKNYSVKVDNDIIHILPSTSH